MYILIFMFSVVIQGLPNCFARFQSVAQLASLLNEHIEPLLILGGGSNILLTKDFEGTVLKNEINGIDVFKEDEDFAFVKVGAGVVWQETGGGAGQPCPLQPADRRIGCGSQPALP